MSLRFLARAGRRIDGILPRSLLARSFVLIAGLMLLFAFTGIALLRSFDREPHARQLAQMLASVANLARSALISARPEARFALLRELSEREGLRIYPAEADDHVAPLLRPFLRRVGELLTQQLGPQTRLTVELNGEAALFVSFHIDEDEYWLVLPRERLERFVPAGLIGWGLAALLLSLIGGWLIVWHLARPMQRLARAAAQIGRGQRPPPLPERGVSEMVALARAFNRMNADLARLDEDRALILAGVSHDLRTPLTRLRLDIEFNVADEAQRAPMIADIEEMDRTIGQFLDFARGDGGEAPTATDLSELLADLVGQFRRRGVEVHLAPFPALIQVVRPKALRRAVANLIENALRHAHRDATAVPVELTLRVENETIAIEVADRGPGIPAEEIERLKLPFTRREQARTGTGGAGLGLAIVERIAQAHGGRLVLANRADGGLSARIEWPLRPECTPRSQK